MTTVTLDGVLAGFVPKRHFSTSAASVADLFDELEGKYPALRFRMRDETGAVRRFIKVFVNGTDIAGGRG